MKIYSSLIWSHSEKGKLSAASLDTHEKQCLQNPLIFPAIQYVCVPIAKMAMSSLTLTANPLLSLPSSNCHLTSEKKAAIIALQ